MNTGLYGTNSVTLDDSRCADIMWGKKLRNDMNDCR